MWEEKKHDLGMKLRRSLGMKLRRSLGIKLRRSLGMRLRRSLGMRLRKELGNETKKELGTKFLSCTIVSFCRLEQYNYCHNRMFKERVIGGERGGGGL